jgi:hypothetical protein
MRLTLKAHIVVGMVGETIGVIPKLWQDKIDSKQSCERNLTTNIKFIANIDRTNQNGARFHLHCA